MSPPRLHRPNPEGLRAETRWKEFRRMTRKLNRILDVTSHVTIVFLALYVGVATFGLGVA